MRPPAPPALGAVGQIDGVDGSGVQSPNRERRLRRQFETLVEASASLLSSLDLAEVLPGVLGLARRLISVDAYAVWRRETETGEWRVISAAGLSEEFRNARIPSGAGTMVLRDQPVVIEDVATTPALSPRRASHEAEGIRSMLVAPLRIHGRTSGTIVFYHRSQRRFSPVEVQVAAALANLAGAAIGTAEVYQEQRRLRAEAEEAERRSRFLAEAGTMLGSSLDYETTLSSMAHLIVPSMADWCSVDMVDEDGSLRQLALAHRDPSKEAWAREFARRYRPNPEDHHGISQVIRTGLPEMWPEISDSMLENAARDSEHLAVLREARLKSYMCVPLRARGRTLGALTFLTAESSRQYNSADLALATSLAERAALAVDNARLYATAERERVSAQAALAAQRESEARFHRLLDSGIIGIVLGEGDRIADANEVFLETIGHSRDVLVAGHLRWSELTPQEFRDADYRALAELKTRGACTPFEKEYVKKDGTRVPVLFGAATLKTTPEVSFVGFVIDLTERKRLEERLKESQKLESIGLLAGGIAHDFNNLLTGIMGNVSLALDDIGAAHPVRRLLDSAVTASQRAADLTRQLLAYSGKGRFVIQPVSLSDLVHEMASLVPSLVSKKVRFVFNLEDGLPPVEADAGQMQQLVMNLVVNAAEAIGERAGTVFVATGVQQVDPKHERNAFLRDQLATGAYVFLEVRDTGCGMDESVRSKIFDPFFTTKFTGRGLGLAAVLGIIRGHHGDIQVRSTPGAGSTFRVLLPAAQPAAAEHPVEDLRGAGTILVVDDEEIVRRMAKVSLERYGYTVLVAENGREGVDLFCRNSNEIALVLLDTAMPVMSGEEALVQMSGVRPDIPVIVSSGYSEKEAIQRFQGQGIAAFVQKPYSAPQLAAKVKRVLGSGRRTSGAGNRV